MTSQADGYVFVKGCSSCPLRARNVCAHPQAAAALYMDYVEDMDNQAHPDCPLRRHSLHIALEPTA